MKRKKLSKIFNFSVLIFVLFIASLSYFYLTNKNNSKSVKAVPESTTPNTGQTPESVAQTTTTQTAENKNEIPDIPILMYHHIRTVSDQSDQIGLNLSVDPQKFARQLDLISNNGYVAINFNDILTGNIPAKPVILTFDDGYNNFYSEAYPELKKRNMKAVSYVIYKDIGQNDYMSEDQIKEIASNNIEIGSHTLSHPDLTKVTTERINTELMESKEKLEARFGIKVISLCYPSGKVNSIVENTAKSAGYSFAVTTNNKLTNFSNQLLLNRYRVNHDTNISVYIK